MERPDATYADPICGACWNQEWKQFEKESGLRGQWLERRQYEAAQAKFEQDIAKVVKRTWDLRWNDKLVFGRSWSKQMSDE